jgi:hypothetical protein
MHKFSSSSSSSSAFFFSFDVTLVILFNISSSSLSSSFDSSFSYACNSTTTHLTFMPTYVRKKTSLFFFISSCTLAIDSTTLIVTSLSSSSYVGIMKNFPWITYSFVRIKYDKDNSNMTKIIPYCKDFLQRWRIICGPPFHCEPRVYYVPQFDVTDVTMWFMTRWFSWLVSLVHIWHLSFVTIEMIGSWIYL